MLIHRDGWQYSGKTPAFFSGQSGCSCCPPPPPPPPPPFVYYRNQYGYLYGRAGIVPFTCEYCDTPDKQVAEKWQLEIDGVGSVTPPDPCSANAGGTDCAGINGTWILTRGGKGDEYYTDMLGNNYVTKYCVWWSPGFNWVSTFPLYDAFGRETCRGCAKPQVSRFELWLETYINLTTNTVVNKQARLFVFSTAAAFYGITEWRHADGPDQFACLGVNEFSLYADPFYVGAGDAGPASPYCCQNVPTTVFLLPL